ncbi:hypothetical protein [Holospora curviuscula]|uniref:F0F1 ATP synthase subunit epsilon n=1 Tax=Holospora curviuscula TaxID=1082868 RepID=A0A2S5R825_9PROT|nr:hypothetical protein [Holospora curviuscula]PPE03486.1 F0F1 ATP synthase subunit epsilon [Holospora curviuscula]
MHSFPERATFRVTLKHINRAVYSGNIERMIFPTSTGDLDIGPDHCTLFQVVTPGWIKLWPVQEVTSLEFLSTGGVLEILHNHAILDAFHLVEAHQRPQVESLLKTLHNFYHDF